MKRWKSLWWWMKNVVREGRLHILALVIPKENVVVGFAYKVLPVSLAFTGGRLIFE